MDDQPQPKLHHATTIDPKDEEELEFKKQSAVFRPSDAQLQERLGNHSPKKPPRICFDQTSSHNVSEKPPALPKSKFREQQQEAFSKSSNVPNPMGRTYKSTEQSQPGKSPDLTPASDSDAESITDLPRKSAGPKSKFSLAVSSPKKKQSSGALSNNSNKRPTNESIASRRNSSRLSRTGIRTKKGGSGTHKRQLINAKPVFLSRSCARFPMNRQVEASHRDIQGNPILELGKSVPALQVEKANEIPIQGLPLVSYNPEKKLVGKEKSDTLWQVFSSMIIHYANKRGNNKNQEFLMSQMIDAREHNLEIEEYVKRAMTVGVGIEKHGLSSDFKERVDQYKALIDDYLSSKQTKEDEAGPNYAQTNIKLDAQIQPKKQALKPLKSPKKSSNKSPARRRTSSDGSQKLKSQTSGVETDFAYRKKHKSLKQSLADFHKRLKAIKVNKVIVYETVKEERLGSESTRQLPLHEGLTKEERINLIRYGPGSTNEEEQKIEINLLKKYKPILCLNEHKVMAKQLEREAIAARKQIIKERLSSLSPSQLKRYYDKEQKKQAALKAKFEMRLNGIRKRNERQTGTIRAEELSLDQHGDKKESPAKKKPEVKSPPPQTNQSPVSQTLSLSKQAQSHAVKVPMSRQSPDDNKDIGFLFVGKSSEKPNRPRTRSALSEDYSPRPDQLRQEPSNLHTRRSSSSQREDLKKRSQYKRANEQLFQKDFEKKLAKDKSNYQEWRKLQNSSGAYQDVSLKEHKNLKQTFIKFFDKRKKQEQLRQHDSSLEKTIEIQSPTASGPEETRNDDEFDSSQQTLEEQKTWAKEYSKFRKYSKNSEVDQSESTKHLSPRTMKISTSKKQSSVESIDFKKCGLKQSLTTKNRAGDRLRYGIPGKMFRNPLQTSMYAQRLLEMRKEEAKQQHINDILQDPFSSDQKSAAFTQPENNDSLSYTEPNAMFSVGNQSQKHLKMTDSADNQALFSHIHISDDASFLRSSVPAKKPVGVFTGNPPQRGGKVSLINAKKRVSKRRNIRQTFNETMPSTAAGERMATLPNHINDSGSVFSLNSLGSHQVKIKPTFSRIRQSQATGGERAFAPVLKDSSQSQKAVPFSRN